MNRTRLPEDDDMPRRTNYLRRLFGVLVAVAPFFLMIASVSYWIDHKDSSDWRGIWCGSAGAAIGLQNFYLSFVRPLLHRLSRGNLEGYKFVSGLPMIGTILTVLAVIYGFGSGGTAAIGVCALIWDTGGLPWFVLSTWRDRSLWDQ
jgi:hypothetical protein